MKIQNECVPCLIKRIIFEAEQSTSDEEVIKKTIGDLVQRLFGGNPVPLMQHLALHSEISDEDIEKLRELAKKK